MKFINLTPHEINVVNPCVIITIPPSGTVARVSVSRQVIWKAETEGGFGIPIFVPSFGNVENLPEPHNNTYFIVSTLVRTALPHRLDLISPGNLVRDDNGNVIGCDGFDCNHELI